MADNFGIGEEDSDLPAPPFETQGARYGISVSQPGRGVHEQQVEPYLMPSIHGRNGSLERVDPSIVQTPLGGLMPGPFAIPPAVPAGNIGAFPVSDDGAFGMGVNDSWPEGSPVPVRG